MFRRDHGLILALDVNNLDSLSKLIDISCKEEYVVGYKVGFSLVIRYGLKVVSRIIRYKSFLPIIYDHQKGGTDIPRMGEAFMKACKYCNVQGVILFPLSGPNTLETWVKAAFEQGLIPIVGGMMTHEGFLENESGYLSFDAPKQIYRRAIRQGVEYFVLPGNKPKEIEQMIETCFFNKRLSFFLPGIGTQGGTIREAFKACGWWNKAYAIVGSDIYKAEDPREVLNKYVKEIKEWEEQYGI